MEFFYTSALGVPPSEIVRIYATGSTSGVNVPTGQVVDRLGTAFDFNSITMPSTTKYTNGAPLYTIKPTAVGSTVVNPAAAGTLARLSRDDCRGLQALYSTIGCSGIVCQDRTFLTVIPSL